MITLATLGAASLQDVFTQAKEHLLKQNEKSIDEQKRCRYRIIKNGKTLRCGAGIFISDDEYRKEFEGETWHNLAKSFKFAKKQTDLIQRIQNVHDVHEPSSWELALKIAAKEFKLTY